MGQFNNTTPYIAMKIRKETERANYILDTLDTIYPTGILARL